MKPHIVFFQENISLGATEEYFHLLMQGMDRTEFWLTCVCPDNVSVDPFADKLKSAGIEVYRYPVGSNAVKLASKLVKLFLDLKPDIVHFNDTCSFGIICARIAAVRSLVMTHHTPELNREYNLLGAIAQNLAFHCCGLRVIYTSEFDREAGSRKDKLPLERSSVIYYGLPLDKFEQKFDKREIFAEFKLSDDSRVVGNIGRLVSQKGQNYLIEAAPLIIEKFSTVKFFICGEGELEAELKAAVRGKGLQEHFIFTGYRSDIIRILSIFEVLAMPSLFEGLCFAALEALAMGVPVVASNVGGLRRSVDPGKTGLLVEPASRGALAEAIIRVLEKPDEAKAMGEAAKAYFREHFTQKQMVEKTVRLYESILTR